MLKQALWLAWIVLAATGAATGGDNMNEPCQPVFVELFTSEGCSSCPPADALLEKLDRDQPIAGARIIVLSEHVDYWNDQGWSDPYSSAAFSRRQEMYAQHFHIHGPYTPEMVVNGVTEFVGSDAASAERAIRAALQVPQAGIRMIAVPGDAAVTLEVDPLPAGAAHKANIYLAHAAESGASSVQRGENQGRTLHHVSIAKDIEMIGKINSQSGFKTRIALHGQAGSRLIAFIQDPGDARVWGAAMYHVPK